MYTKEILPGVDLYLICLCLAIISALVIFRIMADKMKISAKLQNLCLYIAVGAIFFGYLSAVFFQALYNIKPYGEFAINKSTGATFYGGLIGGAGLFLALYFGLGKLFFKNKEHISGFFDIANIAAAAIAAAHGFGRIGCFMAGCCYGRPTEAWYGVYFSSYGIKAVPVQLFEAIFLFALFGFFWYRIVKRKSCNLPLYMMLYGIWRFVIEFFRSDDRGATIVKFLSPSQLIAILMVVGAVGLFFGECYIEKKMTHKTLEAESTSNELESVLNNDGAEAEKKDEKNED